MLYDLPGGAGRIIGEDRSIIGFTVAIVNQGAGMRLVPKSQAN